MKTVGIIAEYNPFHNGHAYHIRKAKELTGADYCIVVMSGDFVQRGTPALMDKHLRTSCALANGADLVLELPVCYAVSSAEYFARGAAALLDRLGVVDSLCFGSECGDIDILMQFAKELLHETPVFKRELSRSLRMGHSYPQARNAALEASAPHLTAHLNALSTPNNILGIEYCKAILSAESRIAPCTIKRAGGSYHDNSLESDFCSAQAIRESLQQPKIPDSVIRQVPASANKIAAQAYMKSYPIFANDISPLVHYSLLSGEAAGFTGYPDIDKELSDRIRKKLPKYHDFESFCELLKSKNRTYVRISRSLLHILLDIRKEDFDRYQTEGPVFYARILGFRENAAPLLSALKEKSQIPLLSKLADAEKQLAPTALSMLEKDIYASHVYQSIVRHKFPDTTPFPEICEQKRQIIKM
ncbi:MAG: nucleotidyltransferase [Bacteroidales bacterium]|nr:nucleotidyltransferase [Bacteroidales bacterium]MCM1415211.1 nucleotidyltransferase [bacterium]MCM1423795.1 nucleotidyltransferase [bacterium]